MLLTYAGGTLPAGAQNSGVGDYVSVTVTNTTPWCVRFSLFNEVAGGAISTWQFRTYSDVPPNKSYTFSNNVHFYGIKLQADLWAQGNCSGAFVGSRSIHKEATAPQGQNIAFGAVAQFDHAGPISSPIFNFYFGADTVLGAGKF